MASHDVYLNGQYLPYERASLAIDDRGAMFADGVYEVIAYHGGRAVAMDAHVARLKRSLAGIELDADDAAAALPQVSDELVARAQLPHAKVYWQITRGAARREHLPPSDMTPTVFATVSPAEPIRPDMPVACWHAAILPDQRWANCWIKSLMLLPSVLARREAARRGCQEAILHRDGRVTEGSAANVFLVRDGELHTPPLTGEILPGVTRQMVLDLARARGIDVRETACTVAQLRAADELFVTGTTAYVTAVTHLDGQAVGGGEAGALTRTLQRVLLEHILSDGAAAGA